jgi:hypothetical protein
MRFVVLIRHAGSQQRGCLHTRHSQQREPDLRAKTHRRGYLQRSRTSLRHIAHQYREVRGCAGEEGDGAASGRAGEQAVTVDRAAWRLRISYSAWDAWLTAEAHQKAQDALRPSLEGKPDRGLYNSDIGLNITVALLNLKVIMG